MSLVELADHILAHTAVGVGVRDSQIVVDVLQPKLWGISIRLVVVHRRFIVRFIVHCNIKHKLLILGGICLSEV